MTQPSSDQSVEHHKAGEIASEISIEQAQERLKDSGTVTRNKEGQLIVKLPPALGVTQETVISNDALITEDGTIVGKLSYTIFDDMNGIHIIGEFTGSKNLASGQTSGYFTQATKLQDGAVLLKEAHGAQAFNHEGKMIFNGERAARLTDKNGTILNGYDYKGTWSIFDNTPVDGVFTHPTHKDQPVHVLNGQKVSSQ